jgi:hypothetical protein
MAIAVTTTASTKVRAFLDWADAHGLTSYSVGVAAPSITVSFVRNTRVEAEALRAMIPWTEGLPEFEFHDKLAGAQGWAFGGFVDIVSREQVSQSGQVSE